jgi:3-oxoadipate enol-lactonase
MMTEPAVVSHQVDGEGEALVLCNGIAMSAPSWEIMAAPLAERYRVVRFDFRGQLLSPGRPPGDVAEHAEDLVALLDHLGIESAHLVSTSFGGAVAALVAARFPERSRSLISIASADGFDGVMAAEVLRWRQGCVDALESGDRGVISDVLEPVVYSAGYLAAHRDDRVLRRKQIAALPENWFRGLIGLLDSTPSVTLADELGNVRCPTLIVAAELDGFIPLERTRALAESIPGARFEIVEGAGHAVVVEQPGRLVELCLEFLDGVSF